MVEMLERLIAESLERSGKNLDSGLLFAEKNVVHVTWLRSWWTMKRKSRLEFWATNDDHVASSTSGSGSAW